jgi:hypothetical protein
VVLVAVVVMPVIVGMIMPMGGRSVRRSGGFGAGWQVVHKRYKAC